MKTTQEERSPRIAALVHDADSASVQRLLEVAVQAIAKEQEGEHALTGADYGLASRIKSTFEPADEPGFEVGARVAVGDGDLQATGEVKDRYLNESGDWEYQVQFGRPFNTTEPYAQDKLTAQEG